MKVLSVAWKWLQNIIIIDLRPECHFPHRKFIFCFDSQLFAITSGPAQLTPTVAAVIFAVWEQQCLMLLTNAIVGDLGPLLCSTKCKTKTYVAPLCHYSHRTWLKVVSENLPNSWQKRWKRYKENCWCFSSMSTKFFENQKTYEKIGKLLAPLTVENVAQFLFFLVSLPLSPLLATYLGASFIKANLPKSSPVFSVATVPLPCITTSTEPLSRIYQERPSSPWLNTESENRKGGIKIGGMD